MDAFLDMLWLKIVAGTLLIKNLLDSVFSPIDALGPLTAVFAVALVTVVVARLLSKTCKTRRYRQLRREFQHWYRIRQEALQLKDTDPEKARALARNIDQGKLNKLYYDYFFEGFMLNLATRYLPFFIFLAYVNESYRPEALLARFGRDHLLQFQGLDGNPMQIGALLWFVIAVLAINLLWWAFRKAIPTSGSRTDSESAESAEATASS